MKTFQQQAAQGDFLITRIDELPNDVKRLDAENGLHIIAHSETGHNHVVSDFGADFYQAANDDFVAYLVVNYKADITHMRSFDTHETLRVNPGIYRINRQREYTSEGFRRAAD